MPSWNDLLSHMNSLASDRFRSEYILEQQNECLRKIGELRGDRHVILYGSAFLQKPNVPAENLLVTHEDINGLMTVTDGMESQRDLSLILHTSGGRPEAADSIIAYLRSKFRSIEVIIPVLATSAGTMIGLGADRLIMGPQSRLGPIDPQLSFGGGSPVSARAITEQFERARDAVLKDVQTAPAWTPIIQCLAPSLLQEAHGAMHYSESMVARLLKKHMFADREDPERLAKSVARYFNDASRKRNRVRIIDRDEARANHIIVEDLESDQELQEAVLTSYYLMTINFEKSLTTKILWSDIGLTWMKPFARAPS